MKKNFDKMRLWFLCLYLLLVIFDSKSALLSTKKALDLCLMTVIPSIFPLLFISAAIAAEAQNIRLPFLERILRIPKGTSCLFLMGLLCGYPVGGKILQDQINRNTIEKQSATRMMLFCNNAGPAFIIGILSSVFSGKAAIIMWLIQIITSIILGLLLPVSETGKNCHTLQHSKNPAQIMADSLKAIATICGWVIIFGILNGYIDRIILNKLNPISKALISGVTELTNGITRIQEIQSKSIAFTVCCVLLSFGGLCVVLQTKSVAPDLKIIPYMFARTLHAGISGTLATLSCIFLFPGETVAIKTIPPFLCAIFVSGIVLFFNKKSNSISKKAVV